MAAFLLSFLFSFFFLRIGERPVLSRMVSWPNQFPPPLAGTKLARPWPGSSYYSIQFSSFSFLCHDSSFGGSTIFTVVVILWFFSFRPPSARRAPFFFSSLRFLRAGSVLAASPSPISSNLRPCPGSHAPSGWFGAAPPILATSSSTYFLHFPFLDPL